MANHHHRSLLPHSRKDQVEEDFSNVSQHWLVRKPRPSFIRLFFLLLLFSFLLLFISRLPVLLFSDQPYGEAMSPFPSAANACSISSPLCCDRSGFRTDFCFLNGDIRTGSSSSSFFIFSNYSSSSSSEERIRPYTRKWEVPVMSTIDELRLSLRPANSSVSARACDVRHDVPAVVFSTGGYTGNVYHEFNDGIIPLYLTSRRFNRRVIFVIIEYHSWWISKYSDVLSVLSDYPAVDFSADSRTHCFSQAIVGLQIHDELAIDGQRTENNESIADFRRLLNEAYRPRIRSIPLREEETQGKLESRPKLVIVCRNGSRAIENESELAASAEEVGFRVELLRPHPTTEMAKIYLALNSSDAMIGVHGAAMTHLLFMRPESVFIQIVPLGLDWAAAEYYGNPAVKAGLRYERYRILARESSLAMEYGKDDPVLRNPESVNARGWETTKKVYLDGQRVRLDLVRFRKRLVRAHRFLLSKLSKKAEQRRNPASNVNDGGKGN
ncbi:hypothetical protein KSP39_PZI002759 [Platanthera zijinensis]|uniref:Glycosyltransferase 61 catalytic domain-containing protein n=1 Tax=Platanthera zijinensis TaxID=2320716 RepID=A0AAP0BXC2_9ASPA